MIISEDGDSTDPDDNGAGGTIIFTFDQAVELHSVGILDIDGVEAMGVVTAYNGAGDVLASGTMEPLGDTLFAASAGAEQVKVEFVVEENGAVNKLLMHRDGQKIPVLRVEE